MVLLSAGCLILTVSRAIAEPKMSVTREFVGVGCDDSYVYFYDDHQLKREPKNKATNR